MLDAQLFNKTILEYPEARFVFFCFFLFLLLGFIISLPPGGALRLQKQTDIVKPGSAILMFCRDNVGVTDV